MREFFALSVYLLVYVEERLLQGYVLHDSHDSSLDAKLPGIIVLLFCLSSLTVALDLVTVADNANLDFYELAIEAFVE
jgi:hypothetical protein